MTPHPQSTVPLPSGLPQGQLLSDFLLLGVGTALLGLLGPLSTLDHLPSGPQDPTPGPAL